MGDQTSLRYTFSTSELGVRVHPPLQPSALLLPLACMVRISLSFECTPRGGSGSKTWIGSDISFLSNGSDISFSNGSDISFFRTARISLSFERFGYLFLAQWIQNLERENKLTVIKLTDGDYLRTLENAVQVRKRSCTLIVNLVGAPVYVSDRTVGWLRDQGRKLGAFGVEE